MADVTVEFGATDTGLDTTLKGIRDSMKNLETQQRTTAMSTDEVEKSMRELKKLQGMEKLFMDLSGETAKLAEAEKIATEATKKLAAEEMVAAQATKKLAEEIAAADIKKLAEEEKAAIEATKKLAAEEEILAKTQEKMNQPLLTTSERLGLVRTQMEYLKEKAATASLQAHELDETMKKLGELSKTEKSLSAVAGEADKVGKESEATTKSVKTLGTAAEDTGKKGEIGFGKIAVGATLAGAAAKVGSMAIDAAFAVAQKTIASFGDALAMGGRLKELSDRTGVAVDRLLLLERAFHNAGIGADAVGPIVNKMQKAIVDASDGSSKAADAFSQLGIKLSDLEKMSPEDQLRTIGKAIAGIPNEADRAAISIEVFGKSGGALNQLFSDFDGGIETAKDQLGSLPALMKGAAEQFDRIDENLFSVGQKFVEFAAGILDKVAPALDAVTTALTRIDAAKIGQDLADFFLGAGEGMKGFQAAVDAIEAGEMGTAFKIVGQAIQLQFKETANSAYTNMVAAFKSAGQFIATVFDPEGMLMTYINGAFNLVALNAAAAIAQSISDMLPKIAGFSPLRRGMEEFAATAKEDAAGLFGAMYYDAESLGKELAVAGSEFSTNFEKNMAGVTPLFTDLEKHQQEIDRLQQGITKSTKETTAAVSEADKAAAKAEQDARKAEKDAADKAAKALEDAEKSAKAEAEKQAKLEETLRLKREEHNAQLGINNAIASGNFQEAEALKNEESLRKIIQGLVSSGFLEDEATKMANELERSARAAERIKNSLATKIGADIKSKQDTEAVDPGGRLMKKAQEQIAAGRYGAAEATARQIKAREQDAMIRGTGEGKDRRAIQDIARDYGLRGSDKEIRDELYKIRTEGQGTSDKVKKSLESTQKRMGEGMKKEAEKKVEEKKTPMTLEGMVKIIQEAVVKLEMKLPQPVMV